MRLGVALYIFASLPVGKSYRVVNELDLRSVIELRGIEGVGSYVSEMTATDAPTTQWFYSLSLRRVFRKREFFNSRLENVGPFWKVMVRKRSL